VLSTLHTNSAAASIARLLDMGARGYLLASALNGVLAQRLARRLCKDCSAPAQPDEHQLAWLEAVNPKLDLAEARFQRGHGCSKCNHSGYRGRIGIYELLMFDAPLLDALRAENLSAVAAAIDAQRDYQPLGKRALELALRAVISLDEVIRLHGQV
jgi:MSHA biogenesis protein MshE